MSNKAKLAGLKKRIESRPAPPNPADQWRRTLKQIAKVYGDDQPAEMAEIDAMSDEEVRAEWARAHEALERIYSMSDEEFREFSAGLA